MAAREGAILAGIGLVMAFLNPFNSVGEVSLAVGVAYWVSLIVYGGLVGHGAAALVRRFAPQLPLWGYVLAVSTLIAFAVFPAVAAAQFWVTHAPIATSQMPRFFFYVLLIALIVSTGIILGFRTFGARSAMFDPQPQGPPQPPPTTRARPDTFLERLPIRLRTATLYAVESEDHYLRVHTSAGQELILMRLADAIRELSTVDGLQTHRSWWVARDGLADVAREKGRLVLKLKSGQEAPVSRTYVPAVRERNWI